MKKITLVKSFTVLFLLFHSTLLKAQDKENNLGNAVISGRIMDQTLNEPLPFVTIRVKARESGVLIDGQITDEKGRFKVSQIPQGNFIVEFQFIGFQTLSREITLSVRQKLDMGTLFLKEAITAIDGVEVIAERSTIEQKVDRKVINIGKDLATSGVTAADLMTNIPSVNVDPDGAVSLRGNDNVRILVDGKPTNLSASQLLQQVPAATIKSIELITNPSAKFIPDGMSGIINIVLHKNSNLGLNGNVSTGFSLGQEYRFTGSADLNYKTSKFNLYVNYGNNHGLNPTFGEIVRPDDPSKEFWTFMDDPVSHLVKTGIDYSLSDHTVFSAYTIQNKFDNHATRFTAIQFPEAAVNNFSQGYVSAVGNKASTYNFDLKHQFTEEGAQLEFELDYSDFSEEDLAAFSFEGASIGSSNANETIDIARQNTTLNLDYTKPIGKNKKLEIGAEARIQKTQNQYHTNNPNFNSSQYDFNRETYSGYVSYSHNMNKWSYQIGVRLEGFDMTGLLEEAGQPNQHFGSPIFSIYPSAFLSYVPNPETQRDAFNLSISRRVDRPNLSQMTPIRIWSSPRITNIGNPALVPQFTNSIELNYTRQLKEGSITTGAFFRRIEDEITRFGFIDPENPENIFFSYNNYQNNSAYGFELSGNYKLASFWSFTSSFDLYTQTQRGVVRDELREVQNVLYNFRMNHSFKASEKLTFQLVNLYRGANTNLQYRRLAFHFINVGARYSVFGGKGTLSVNFNDIFKTQQNSFEGERPFLQVGVFDWDSRTVTIGYSHRFGNGKNQLLKRKKRDRNETKSGGF